jgi:hypothetical protein
MGLTGFNLVRREEEAAASVAASLATEPDQACTMPEPEEPKKARKKGNLPTAEAEG